MPQHPDPIPPSEFPRTLPDPWATPQQTEKPGAAPASEGASSPPTVDAVSPPTVAPADAGPAPTPAAPDERSAQAGRYVIEGEVGHGGMGVVLRARDPTFNRSLAVKILHTRHRGNPDLEKRFLEEARLTAQLQHPGVPPVHDQGHLEDGRP